MEDEEKNRELCVKGVKMKKFVFVMLVISLIMLVACGGPSGRPMELSMIEVDFQLPERAEVNEMVELKAIVTHGGEFVTDADHVYFEYWLRGKEGESKTIDAINRQDGTYTATVSFPQDGVYEIYAHTTARNMHVMPKKPITVGTGQSETQP